MSQNKLKLLSLTIFATAITLSLSANARSVMRNFLTGVSVAKVLVGDVQDQCKGQKHCRSEGMGQVILQVGLNGCLDQLGEVASHLDIESNTLYVTALNLNMSASESVKCIAAPFDTSEFIVGGANEKTKIVDLGLHQRPLRSAFGVQKITGGTFARLVSGKVTDQCTDPRCKSRGMGKVELIYQIGGCSLNVKSIAYEIDSKANVLYVSGITEKLAAATERRRCANHQKIEAIIGGTNSNTKVVGVGGFSN